MDKLYSAEFTERENFITLLALRYLLDELKMHEAWYERLYHLTYAEVQTLIHHLVQDMVNTYE